MVNVAILAFCGEMCSTFVQQLGLVLQKLAHRDNEKKQKQNLKAEQVTNSVKSSNDDDRFVEIEKENKESVD